MGRNVGFRRRPRDPVPAAGDASWLLGLWLLLAACVQPLLKELLLIRSSQVGWQMDLPDL